MRILIVSQYFWPESFRINDLADGLAKRGHQVDVLTGLPNYPSGRLAAGYSLVKGPWRESFKGIPVGRVPLIPRGRASGLRLALNYLSFVISGSSIGLARIRRRPDVIVVCQLSPVTVGIPAALFKRWLKAPMVFWVQDLWPDSLSATGAVRSSTVLALVDRLTRWIYRRCDRVLAQSRSFLPRLLEQRVPGCRTGYFPNWAEDCYAPVDPGTATAERAMMPSGFVVMFAGNLGTAQAMPTLLAAAERLRSRTDIHWVLLGDGAQRTWIEAEIARRGLGATVHLLGSFPVAAMPRFFSCAGALLVTLTRSPAFAMTIPSKLQSYLACARPIVAALDGEGARLVAEARAGLAGPAEDDARLAENVATLAALGNEEREAMGQRGLAAYRREFDRGRLLDHFDVLLMETVRESRCGS